MAAISYDAKVLWQALATALNQGEVSGTVQDCKNWLDTNKAGLRGLTHLSIHNDQIKTLSSRIKHLQNLKTLHLQMGALERLPELSALVNLEELTLINPLIDKLPDRLEQMQYEMNSPVPGGPNPTEFERLTRLLEERSNNNGDQAFFEQICGLRNLRKLNLQLDFLESIPEKIGNLKLLSHLDLEGNNIEFVHPRLGSLPLLKVLNLHGNKIKTLPNEIGNLRNLESLDLTLNPITELPSTIEKLEKLKKLKLHNCGLRAVPPQIGKLTSLKVMDLAYNRLRALPQEMKNLVHLEKFRVDGNPITQIPRELWDLIPARGQLRSIWWGNFCRPLPQIAMTVGFIGVAAWYGYDAAPYHLKYQVNQFVSRQFANFTF